MKEVGTIYGVRVFVDNESKRPWELLTGHEMYVREELRNLINRLRSNGVQLVGIALKEEL